MELTRVQFLGSSSLFARAAALRGGAGGGGGGGVRFDSRATRSSICTANAPNRVRRSQVLR